MFNLQDILDNQFAAKRAEEMKTSKQLMLGELIALLETIDDKNLPIRFDDKKYKPSGLDSWRGSYCELAITYENGGQSCREQPKDTCQRDEHGDHGFRCSCGGSKKYETTLSETPKVKDLLGVLKVAVGKYFIGYKGGDFTMGKNTPVWVANYGTSVGFKENENYDSQAVVGIKKNKNSVVIKTELMKF